MYHALFGGTLRSLLCRWKRVQAALVLFSLVSFTSFTMADDSCSSIPNTSEPEIEILSKFRLKWVETTINKNDVFIYTIQQTTTSRPNRHWKEVTALQLCTHWETCRACGTMAIHLCDKEAKRSVGNSGDSRSMYCTQAVYGCTTDRYAWHACTPLYDWQSIWCVTWQDQQSNNTWHLWTLHRLVIRNACRCGNPSFSNRSAVAHWDKLWSRSMHTIRYSRETMWKHGWWVCITWMHLWIVTYIHTIADQATIVIDILNDFVNDPKTHVWNWHQGKMMIFSRETGWLTPW